MDQRQQQQQFYKYHLQPSQPYDLSAQGYYTYNQDQQYGYYPQSCTGDYHNQQQPASIHPPGVPIPPEQAHLAGPDSVPFEAPHNAYYAQGVYEQQQQQQYIGYSDLGQAGSNFFQTNPAQGSVEQWQVNNGGFGPVRPPIGQSPHRGGGRRGGRPLRGGGRGQFGPHGFEHDGRGHGQGGGHYFPPHNAASTPNSGPASTAEGPGASFAGDASQLQGKAPQALMQPLSGPDPDKTRTTPFKKYLLSSLCIRSRIGLATFVNEIGLLLITQNALYKTITKITLKIKFWESTRDFAAFPKTKTIIFLFVALSKFCHQSIQPFFLQKTFTAIPATLTFSFNFTPLFFPLFPQCNHANLNATSNRFATNDSTL